MMKKTGGRKSRWTVPLTPIEKAHKTYICSRSKLKKSCNIFTDVLSSVVDPERLDAYPYPTFHIDSDPNFT